MSNLLPALPAAFASRTDLLAGNSAHMTKLLADPAITDDQWNQLADYFKLNVSSPVQPSITCKDGDCPYITTCPLKLAKIERPTGEPCIIEETVKRNWIAVYMPEVGKSTDGYAAVDTGMVIDLVNTLLDIHRAQGEVADMPNVAERVLRGFDKDQNPITDLKMNPLHFYLANARKLKITILGQLVATRDARKKDKSRQTTDATQLLTEMRATIGELVRREAELKLMVADATVVDVQPLEDDDDPNGSPTPTT